MLRECAICGKEFDALHKNHLYCGAECGRVAKNIKRRDKRKLDAEKRAMAKGGTVLAKIRENAAKYAPPTRKKPKTYHLHCKNCGAEFTSNITVSRYCCADCKTAYQEREKNARERAQRERELAAHRLDDKIREAMRRHCSYGELQVIKAREAAKKAREARQC